MNKYKDESPAQTINKISNILKNNKINIDIIERHNNNFWSNQLFILNTPLSYNGKGYGKDFALASGYGETLERLQNVSFYDQRLISQLSTSFNRAPDEQLIDIKNFNNKEQIILQKLNKNQEFALPFYNYLNHNEIYYSSIELSGYIYGSNGMAAGNTLEEALVQGISEVFERYIINQILFNNINCTIIPETILQNFPFYKEILKIKELGYLISFYDFFQTTHFPVVACQIIDPITRTFGMRFGSHLILKIALERTLTELFQGHTELEEITKMCSYTLNIAQSSHNNNIISIFEKGRGVYPLFPFINTDNNFINWPEYNSLVNNQDILQNIIQIIFKNKLKLFFRETSFMGFPACQVLIPELSEVFQLNDYRINRILNIYSNKEKTPLNFSDDTLSVFQSIYNSFK